MINKKKLWFMTLFSIILVLSVYYITMPEDMLVSKEDDVAGEEIKVDVDESDILVSLRIQADKEMQEEMDDLQLVITNVEATVEEKNKAIEEIKELNNIRGLEEDIENKIYNKLKLKSFVKINDNQVRVVVLKDKHDFELANNIMKLVGEEFDKKVSVSVKFQTT